jgi:hypothetical protein
MLWTISQLQKPLRYLSEKLTLLFNPLGCDIAQIIAPTPAATWRGAACLSMNWELAKRDSRHLYALIGK